MCEDTLANDINRRYESIQLRDKLLKEAGFERHTDNGFSDSAIWKRILTGCVISIFQRNIVDAETVDTDHVRYIGFVWVVHIEFDHSDMGIKERNYDDLETAIKEVQEFEERNPFK